MTFKYQVGDHVYMREKDDLYENIADNGTIVGTELLADGRLWYEIVPAGYDTDIPAEYRYMTVLGFVEDEISGIVEK